MATVLPTRPCDSNPATPGAQSVKDDIEEVSNDGSQAPKRQRMGSGDSSRSCDTSCQELGPTYFSAENLTEYRWPSDGSGEYYMLQEQVSEYLGVTSFKRKYPDLERRDLSHKEKLYLREQNVITETQCTLGLTALRSDEVIDLMIKEYPGKHAEYSVILQERERQRITEEYSIIQVPQGRYKVLPPERTKTGPYPVALIPGQFQDYYKRYSPNELRYLPLNTALFEPPLDPELPALDSDGDSDDADDNKGEEGKKNSDSSSGNTSDGDSQDSGVQSKGKAKDRTATPAKDATPRPNQHKSVPGYKPKVMPNAICGICQKGKESNKEGKPEALIHCSQCKNSAHPSCLDMSEELVGLIKTYPWQCMECKTCTVCKHPHHEEDMMFCDTCDRGFHSFCVGLDSIPLGCWVCECCNKESSTPKKKRGRKKQKSKSAYK
ncbi:PHD finger protein 10-like isoform X2 [Salvelinus fontinalis]|uniref:PHD finger protein 10-like isoform X2 n=1 Tax=Salvelinus fontinalis TaxID=8038 RepID=UPI0024869C29|nr:PHD finger protein 10-like isoform X2 [Salvelinus fontinalis]